MAFIDLTNAGGQGYNRRQRALETLGQGLQGFADMQRREEALAREQEAKYKQDQLQALQLGTQYGASPEQISQFQQTGDISGLLSLSQEQKAREKQEKLAQSEFERGIKEKELGLKEQEIKAKTTDAGVARISKLSGEVQGKVGGIASALSALEGMKQSYSSEKDIPRITTETPLVGGFISDTPFTMNRRILSEVVGRLQSGGAINKEEETRFNEMSPRPGDSPEIVSQKFDKQKQFLENKLRAYGLTSSQLAEAGFEIPKGEEINNRQIGIPGISAAVAGQSKLTPSQQARLNELRARAGR